MPQTKTTVNLMRDISEACDIINKTLSRAEKELLRKYDPALAKKVLQLKADRDRLAKEAMYYGLDLKNPQYTSDLSGLGLSSLLPLAVIANIALGNALFVSGLIKEKVPFTMIHGLQVGLSTLLIVLLVPIAFNSFKKAKRSEVPVHLGHGARA